MKEVLKSCEVTMHKFFITIRQGKDNFGAFDKFDINLDTSKDIVMQAEEITTSILDSFEIPKQ